MAASPRAVRVCPSPGRPCWAMRSGLLRCTDGASAPSRDSGSAPHAQLQLGSPRVRKEGVRDWFVGPATARPGPWAALRPRTSPHFLVPGHVRRCPLPAPRDGLSVPPGDSGSRAGAPAAPRWPLLPGFGREWKPQSTSGGPPSAGPWGLQPRPRPPGALPARGGGGRGGCSPPLREPRPSPRASRCLESRRRLRAGAGGLPRPLRHPSAGGVSHRGRYGPGCGQEGAGPEAGSGLQPSRPAAPRSPGRESPGGTWYPGASRRQRVEVRVSCSGGRAAGDSGGLSLGLSLTPGHQTEGHRPGSAPSHSCLPLVHAGDLKLQGSPRQGGASRARALQNQVVSLQPPLHPHCLPAPWGLAPDPFSPLLSSPPGVSGVWL